MKKDCLTITFDPKELLNLRLNDFYINLSDERTKKVLGKMCESIISGGKPYEIYVKPIQITGCLNPENLHSIVERELGTDWSPIDETTYFQLLARGIMRKDCTMEQLARNAAALGGYDDSDEESEPVGDVVGLLGGYHSTAVIAKNGFLKCYGGDNNCYGDIKNCPLDWMSKMHLPPGQESYIINNCIKKLVTYGMKIE